MRNMIRFILRRKWRDNISGLESDEIETILCDAPELEAALIAGGYGENGYDHRQVIGAEIADDA